MNNKAILVIVLAVATGALSPRAESCTVPLCGLTCLANSLDASPNNRADHVIPFSDGDNLQIWTGFSWEVWMMDSLSSTGWYAGSGHEAPLTALPILGPGKAFFYGNSTGKPSLTFSGALRTGTNTVTIHVGLNALGSPLPYGGPITSALGLPVQWGNNIQKWNCNTGRWEACTRDSLSATGWTDGIGLDCPEPTIAIGEGFFYGNNTGPFNWTQILNP